jgi:hypothetical protein
MVCRSRAPDSVPLACSSVVYCCGFTFFAAFSIHTERFMTVYEHVKPEFLFLHLWNSSILYICYLMTKPFLPDHGSPRKNKREQKQERKDGIEWNPWYFAKAVKRAPPCSNLTDRTLFSFVDCYSSTRPLDRSNYKSRNGMDCVPTFFFLVKFEASRH